MTNLAVSRRAVTCALATLPAIAIPSIAAATSRAGMEGDDTMNAMTKIVPAKHSMWEAALARHHAANVASDRFDDSVFSPTWRELERRAPRPSLSFSVTAKSGRVAHYDLLPAELDEIADNVILGGHVAPIRDAWNEYVRLKSKAEADLGWEAIEAQHEKLLDAIIETHEELMLMPAPHLAALRWKLEQTIEPGEKGGIAQWSDDAIRLAIVGDYERLLPAG